MLSNDEMLNLINDSSKKDSWRLEALDQLISNLAVDHLYKIVLDTDRYDKWRKKALDAICEIATLNSITGSEIRFNVGNSPYFIQMTSIHINIPNVANKSAEILFKIVNDSERYDKWRYQCLKYLIKIRHKNYLQRIANDSERYDKWRDEAMKALIHC